MFCLEAFVYSLCSSINLCSNFLISVLLLVWLCLHFLQSFSPLCYPGFWRILYMRCWFSVYTENSIVVHYFLVLRMYSDSTSDVLNLLSRVILRNRVISLYSMICFFSVIFICSSFLFLNIMFIVLLGRKLVIFSLLMHLTCW